MQGYASEVSLHLSDVEEYVGGEEDYDAEIELDENELALMDKFMAAEPSKQATLSSLVMGNISSAKERVESLKSASEINPRIVEVYTK